MNLQKNFIAVAVGVALFGSATIASAAVQDLDGGDSYSYASALVSKASNKITSGATCLLTVAADGFKLKAGTLIPGGANAAAAQRNVRFDLIGGKFTGNPVLLTADEGGDEGVFSSLVQGGAGADHVIFAVAGNKGGAGDVVQADTLRIGFDNGVELTSGATQLGVKYSVYVEADNAANSTDALYSKTYSSVLKLVDGTSVTITDSRSDEIDPAKETLFVDAVEETDLSKFAIPALSSVCDADGSTASLDDAGKLTVTGNFSAFKTTPGDVFLNSQADCKGATNAIGAVVDATATTATFSFTSGTGIATLNTNDYLCVKADKVTSMVAGNYECKVEYKVKGTTNTSDTITSGPTACGNLAFAGSSDRVNFGAEPGGSFQQLYRISNPSSQAGAVTLTVTNDAGKSVTLNLSDLSSISSNDLAAGASTPLIANTEIYAAATTKDATFNHNGGKLRMVARGNFGDDIESGAATFGDANSTDGIILEAIAISGTGAATHVK